MEVHAHSHTARKKWTHYLWEFLMLFLAVFCGFLAEYQLEHKIENDKEKQYMKSMVEDLIQDTTAINNMAASTKVSIQKLDTLLDMFEASSFNDTSDLRIIYQIHTLHVGWVPVIFSQRTLTQLKNAGGLRLIRNKEVADNISLYDSKREEVNAIFNSLDDISTKAYLTGTLIFDFRFIRHNSNSGKIYLLTEDKKILRQYANEVFMDQAFGGIYHGHLVQQKELAVKLLKLIIKEYHLK